MQTTTPTTASSLSLSRHNSAAVIRNSNNLYSVSTPMASIQRKTSAPAANFVPDQVAHLDGPPSIDFNSHNNNNNVK